MYANLGQVYVYPNNVVITNLGQVYVYPNNVVITKDVMNPLHGNSAIIVSTFQATLNVDFEKFV